MFLDFSKNVLLEVQFSKDKVLSRTGAIEEVRQSSSFLLYSDDSADGWAVLECNLLY